MVLPTQPNSYSIKSKLFYQSGSYISTFFSNIPFFTIKLYQIFYSSLKKSFKTTYNNHYLALFLHSLSFTLLLFVLSSIPAIADKLTSPSVRIEMSTINITGGEKNSSSYKVTDTVGQTIQGQFDSAGFTIKSGFQYIYPLIPFSFQISNLDMNFGTVVPNIPSTLAHNLIVTTGSAYGYSVQTIADHALKLVSGTITIPNTTCDLSLTCSITDATPWTDNTAYGFGYNMSGQDVDIVDFVNSTYFRPFPLIGSDNPAIVMSSTGIATESTAIATYKLNIAGDQAAGTYQNNVQYIAVPSF